VARDTPLLWRSAMPSPDRHQFDAALPHAARAPCVNGRAMRSCVMPVSAAEGAAVTTIEGLAEEHSWVQQAWIAHQVPQCGYCQSGMIKAVSAFLERAPTRATMRSTPRSPISAATFARAPRDSCGRERVEVVRANGHGAPLSAPAPRGRRFRLGVAGAALAPSRHSVVDGAAEKGELTT
jgi:hypothetical protein